MTDGVLVIDKPAGPTSFEVVRRLRERLGTRKIGHCGTLDPAATGVLPVCFGEATKLAPFLLDADKEYEATVGFGVETDTLDGDGRVLAEKPAAHVTEAAVSAALGGFRGAIRQVPPMYSALKRDGRPLHVYARAGEEVERAPRDVVVHEIALCGFTAGERPTASLRVRCSKGTYLRTLAADLGRALGTGAHLRALRRTRSGPFGLDRAVTLDAALGREPCEWPVIGLADALAHLPAAEVDAAIARAVEQGKPVACIAAGVDPTRQGPWRLLRPDGSLLAVARSRADQTVETLRVFLVGAR